MLVIIETGNVPLFAMLASVMIYYHRAFLLRLAIACTILLF